MIHVTEEQQVAVEEVHRRVSDRFAYNDYQDKSGKSRLDSPTSLEMLRAEVVSYVTTSMMEFPVLDGWQFKVKMNVWRYDPEYDDPSLKDRGSRLQMDIIFGPPALVTKVTASGHSE